jgi:NADPH2:quinone reductase
MSKAIRIHSNGGPEVMVWEDADPGRPGPGQVLIRHTAVGLNFIDVYYRTGLYPAPGGLPLIPGGEGAGVVEEAGEGVTGLKAGDRVAYAVGTGAYAERRVIPADRLVKVPDTISDEQAAAMMLKGMTAEYLLRRTYKVKAGDTILFHAAAGGVGLIAGQWAKHLGAVTIGTAGSADKVELAGAHGYDHVINYREQDFVAEVNAITKGGKCEVVYDSVGKDTFDKSLNCLRPRGLLALFGFSSGPVAPFDPAVLGAKGSLFLTRPGLNQYIATREELVARADDLFAWLATGKVKVTIDRVFPLGQAAEAHRALESRRTAGKLLLVP